MNHDFDHIGAVLKTARETAGLSLDDVQFRTQLPKSVLLTLEAGNFSEFSSPVYAKSFLAQYSAFLNVEAYPWIEALEPGGFTDEGSLAPVLDSLKTQNVKPPIPTVGHSGWASVLALLALSTGMIVATVKGYEFFESRFSDEKNLVPAKPIPSSPEVGKRALSRKTSIQKDDEKLAERPLRAIIVR